MSGDPAAASLRPVLPADVPDLVALHARAFPPPERWGSTAIKAMLALEGAFGFRAAPGAQGFILARAVAEEAEILTLAVDPDCRRLRLGRRLLSAALAEAKRCGAACLFLEVSEANVAARALYAAAGAEEVGRRRRYYADGTDALVLRIIPPS
ncbi:GNAT family N-acetyltransferase [Roseomonas chloroacetimidivorans]|uniref:GNAT family N-acetyltransferase n=1 Tax=Roseomonas chloroacetimidivorans TaxID=1766656 RepID=UPI003C7849B2